MHWHCGTRWTFTDPCKPEVRPGTREESASPAWLVAPAMNSGDTTKGIYGGLTLDMDRHYSGSVTATTHQEKGIIILESNPLRVTVLPAQHGKRNKSWAKTVWGFGLGLLVFYVTCNDISVIYVTTQMCRRIVFDKTKQSCMLKQNSCSHTLLNIFICW